MQNDTYGEISSDELTAMRASAKACATCGMVATIDPILHEQRYGHAPVIHDMDGTLIWSADALSWIANTVKCQTCAAQISPKAILCERCTASAAEPRRQAPTVSVVSSALRPGHIVREHGMRVRIDEVRPYASSSSSRDRYPTAYSCPGTVLNVAEVREAGIVPLGFLSCSVHPGGRCWHVQGNDLARWAVERHATDCRECRQIIETCTCGSQLCEGWRHVARESHWCVAAHAGRQGCKATPDPEAAEHEL